MRNKLTKKHLDYLVLMTASIISIILAVYFSSNKQIVSTVVISFAVFYFLWGIIHHKYEGTLHTEVIIEYLIYAILGALLIIGLI